MYSLKTGFQVDIMNPYITTILCAAGFILILAILILRNEHQRKKYFLRMIRRIYGQVPDREYEAGDLNESLIITRKSRVMVLLLMTLPGMTLIWTEFICC